MDTKKRINVIAWASILISGLITLVSILQNVMYFSMSPELLTQYNNQKSIVNTFIAIDIRIISVILLVII